jgi:dTDP-4-dehydrorhamnose 3,5-epimerase
MDDWARQDVRANLVCADLTYSVPWTLRGMHYQETKPQGKLFKVIDGVIQLTIVEMREESHHKGRWTQFLIRGLEGSTIWVPPGYATGYLVSQQMAIVHVEYSEYPDPKDSRVLLWNDPRVGIVWGLEPGRTPVMNVSDRAGKLFDQLPSIKV